MKNGSAYSVSAERTALVLTAIMAVLIVAHIVAMQANFNEALEPPELPPALLEAWAAY